MTIRTKPLWTSRQQAAEYGRRGGQSRARRMTFIYTLDGRNETHATIGQKLGISTCAAEARCRRLKKAGAPITWDALRLAPRVQFSGLEHTE